MDRATAAAAIGLLAGPLQADAQASRVPPSLRVEAGAVVSTPYLKDPNGATVRAGVAPAVSVTAAWGLGALRDSPTAATLGLRATRAGVSIRQGGADTPVGPAWQLDAYAGLEQWLGRIGLRAAAGVSWLRGDDEVFPFRYANDSPWHLAGEIGALARLSASRPLSASITTQAYRLGRSGVSESAGTDGTVVRLLIGVRHGR